MEYLFDGLTFRAAFTLALAGIGAGPATEGARALAISAGSQIVIAWGVAQ